MTYEQKSPDGNGPLAYFVPGQLLFMVEHDSPITRRQLAEFVKINSDIGGIRINPPQRLLSFPRSRQRSPFSLVFADTPKNTSTGALLQVLARLERTYDQQIAGLTVRSVTPNWISSGAPQLVVGGPGTRPVPAAPLHDSWSAAGVDTPGTPYSFTFDPALPSGNARNGVEVAILDTAPCHSTLAYAYNAWSEKHPLIRSLLGPSSRLQLHYAYHADMLRMAQFALRDHEYLMPDHGLFVAGIIHSLAPRATLRLIEVLNPYGVGDILSVALGLRRLLFRRSRLPLVINCSLVINIPLPKELDALIAAEPAWSWLKRDDLGRTSWPLEWICDLLQQEKATIVAAAGNDAADGHRPQPRFPAAYSTALGVAALEEGTNRPTSFSNLADSPLCSGFATFGGSTSGNSAKAEAGILGMYTGHFPDGTPSTSGWAWWAGTSFAAPVVSGALAALIGGGSTPDQAIQTLRALSSERTPDNEDMLKATQG